MEEDENDSYDYDGYEVSQGNHDDDNYVDIDDDNDDDRDDDDVGQR